MYTKYSQFLFHNRRTASILYQSTKKSLFPRPAIALLHIMIYISRLCRGIFSTNAVNLSIVLIPLILDSRIYMTRCS